MSNWPHISILDVLTKQNASLYLVLLILSDSQAVPMTRTVKVGTEVMNTTQNLSMVWTLALLNSFLVVDCSWDCEAKLFSYK